ncbi:uncharacterized protein EV422DRAFT_38561 [Fimicolochytrium jonesii]|uniref:uncharacterized protein n=1 Tax=Fimicolochytrium jonesii TaxID=1396493 RepID=UPI0022FDB838|nr:uncharacterized protein EV422DRAFT_38561 [Fimicolochytrium jonesii]KAI8821335.1 hypothetical protein EV422DRAFT_38561 [Fimicolochytrium jonesii]
MGGRDPLAPSTNMPAWTSVGANAAMLPILRFPAPKASEAVYQPVMESRHPSLTRCRKWDNVGYQYAPVDDAATVAARKRDSAGLTKTVVVVTMALLVTIVIIEACLIVGSLLLRQRLQRIHRAVEFDEAEMSSAVKTLKKNQSMLMKSGAADETQVGLVSKLASAVSKRKQSIYEEERPDPVLVECRSVTYRAGDSVHGKRLLDDVTIACRPGSVTAIMGPSGAGKTTLLSLLTRRLKAGAGVEERILYRRRPLSHITAQKFRAMTGFVAQHDAPYYGLTVREVMMFNAMLELPPTIPNIEKVRRVHRLLRLLNLLPCADVVIQRPEANKGGISGGQMRRLSIAVAMLKRPSVIFLDEPTSGLDAKSSLDVAKAMSELGSQGYTVICSIHQPRPEMFALFDQVTVLVHGRLLFSGPPDESVEHFKKLRTRLEAREAGTDNVIEDAAVHRQGTSVVGSDIVSREDGEGADRANPADLVLDVASTIKPIDSAWAARQWFPLDVIDEEEANTAAKVSEGRPPVQPTAIDVGSVEDMTSRSPQPANGRVSTTRNTDIFNETLEVAKKWTVVEGGRVFVPLQGATRRASEPLLRATSGANGVFILKPDWQDRLEIGTTMRSFAMDANSPSADGERSVIEPSTSTSQSLDLLSYNKDAKAIKKVAPPRPSVALQVLIVTGRWWATRPILRKFNMMIVSACGVLILSLLQRRPGTDVLSLVLQTKGLALACIGLPALKNIHISFDYYDDRDIYNFDSQNGTVAAITFFVHRLVYETANATMEGFIAVISAYFILGCNPDPIRIGTAMILFVVYYNCTTTLFTLVYCTRLARPEARSVAFFSQAVLAIVSGIWIKKGDAAIYDGIAWAQYLNPTYWALSALVRTNAADTGECILRKEGVCQATVGDVIAEEARADRISPRSGLFALGIIWATMRCIQLILLYRDAYWDTFYTGVKQSISDWLKKQMTDPENQATAGTQTGASLEAMPDLYPIGKKGNVDRESGMA